MVIRLLSLLSIALISCSVVANQSLSFKQYLLQLPQQLASDRVSEQQITTALAQVKHFRKLLNGTKPPQQS